MDYALAMEELESPRHLTYKPRGPCGMSHSTIRSITEVLLLP